MDVNTRTVLRIKQGNGSVTYTYDYHGNVTIAVRSFNTEIGGSSESELTLNVNDLLELNEKLAALVKGDE